MSRPMTTEIASQTGRLAKGKKKNITPQDRQRRREQMKTVTANRVAAQIAGKAPGDGV